MALRIPQLSLAKHSQFSSRAVAVMVLSRFEKLRVSASVSGIGEAAVPWMVGVRARKVPVPLMMPARRRSDTGRRPIRCRMRSNN
jgi:hypothetical protein